MATTLLAWAAKRAVIARLQSWSDAAGNGLSGVEVTYALGANPERVSVYGARLRSSRAQAGGEHANLFREDIVVEIRVRVQVLDSDQEDAERQAETIAQAVAVAVSAEPRISTGAVAVTATDQDPTIISPDPDPYATVNVVLSVTLSMLTPGA
jgi:hypothetical protein